MKKRQKQALFVSYFILMLLMGSVYTYSIYRPYLLEEFEISFTQSGFPYMASLGFYACSMFGFSRLIKHPYIPRLLLAGTLLLSGGFYVSAIANSIFIFTFGYGFLVGTGVGILYSLALNSVARYFNQNIGLLSGVMLMAFGLSSVITSPLAQAFLSVNSVQSWFLLFALITFLAGLLAFFLYVPQSDKTVRQETNISVISLISLFTLSTFIGLMMIGLSGIVGTQIYGYSVEQIALLISIFAFGNAFARPLYGYLMDRFGFRIALFSINGLVAVATILNLFNQGASVSIFAVSYFIYWFSLGAWLAIMPLLVKQRVGNELYASVYGKVFLGYGIAAIMGTLFSGIVLDVLSETTFIYIGILVLLMLITSLGLYLQLHLKNVEAI